MTNQEVRSPEWILAEEAAEEKTELEDVKLLDRWIYAKNIYKQGDTDYRRALRQSATSQLADLGPELLSSEFDSYIISMVSQQLKVRRQVEAQGSHGPLNAATKSDVLRTHSELAAELPDLSPKHRISGKLQPTSNSSVKPVHEPKVDNELLMELQCLKLKKELREHKAEQKELLSENDRLLRKIRDLRTVYDGVRKPVVGIGHTEGEEAPRESATGPDPRGDLHRPNRARILRPAFQHQH